MTRTTTEVVAAAAERFRTLRARATARLAKARSDATTLRARVQRESQEMMAEAKRRKETDERLLSPWPNQPEVARYQFDDAADEPDRPAREPNRPPRAPRRRPEQDDDDNMSEVDSWLR